MLKPICTLLYHLWKQASPCNVRLKAEFATEAASLFISIPQTWIFLIQWIGWRKLGKLAWNELLDHSSLIFPLLLAPFFFFAFLYFPADLSDILSGFILHPLFPPPSLSIMMNLSIRNWSDRAEFAGKTTNNGLSSLSSYISVIDREYAFLGCKRSRYKIWQIDRIRSARSDKKNTLIQSRVYVFFPCGVRLPRKKKGEGILPNRLRESSQPAVFWISKVCWSVDLSWRIR